MPSPTGPLVPLLGALLVAEGVITQEQINAALMIQQQDYPDERLGEILVRCGYVSRNDLEQALSQQQDLRESLMTMLDTYEPPQADMRALVLSHRSERALCAFLESRGVAADVVSALPTHNGQPSYDLLLIASGDDAHLSTGVSAAATVGLLPPSAADEHLSPYTAALATCYVDQARTNAKLRSSVEQLRHNDFAMQTVATLIRSVTKAATAQDALLKLMMIVRDLISVEAGTLFRLDPSDNRLVFEVVLGPFQNELSQRRLSLDRGIAGWVAREGESLLIPDVRQDSRFEATFDKQTGFQTKSMLCVPLVALGQVRGVLQLINKMDGEFTESDLSLLRITAAVGGMLLLFEALASVSSPSWLGDLF
ncbi:GAF domain-containing protein [Oscillochloris sp. ZM17-4]|uniref:GAF domain-containing protein n=1 Tax=Oscillochloris sp. ZM17-4 TaxID=2866714 RepID=UPI001C737E09|nr:GAF domain-containing protein [Oscillochloris sp. ZM17-4]MBX0328133.1 GAF domain-containing protein [Oscillochloris sp. ZM17-4]